MDATPFHTRLDRYTREVARLQRQSTRLGSLRLLIVIATMLLIYFYLTRAAEWMVVVLVILVLVFFLLVYLHDRVNDQRQMQSALLDVNRKELLYITEGSLEFEDGSEWIDPNHFYSYDLDIFGPKSLFQHLNRTGTTTGKQALATALSKPIVAEKIPERQASIQDLAGRLDWRQKLQALGHVYRDHPGIYPYLTAWSSKSGGIPLWATILSVTGPLVFGILVAALILTGDESLLRWIGWMFMINLGILGAQYKKIKSELYMGDQINTIVRQYARLLMHFENESFEASLLLSMQASLKVHDKKASTAMLDLSRILKRLDSLNNGLVMLIFNGTTCYHMHVLHQLNRWRSAYAPSIKSWLDILSSIEATSSLANFASHHPGFAYPEMADPGIVAFTALGHPLIAEPERVTNDICFDPFRFVLLTGSNMSGKSTFLRSLGVAFVLAGCGAPVCATSARLHLMPVLVSMRIADSLSDHASYFYAEVVRLRKIMTALDQQQSLILLDEILRGTNSDDKRKGTMDFIRQLMRKQAVGILATHDLEVCKLTDEYQSTLANKCFEVEIIENDLHFDYKLRDGICQNQSASFLMRKMGVI